MMFDTSEECFAYLKIHGKEIGAKAQAGDPLAKAVVNVYTILSHGYHENEVGLLMGALDNYHRAHGDSPKGVVHDQS
jgi:hypothetical protein